METMEKENEAKLYHLQGAGDVLEGIEEVDSQIEHVSGFIKESLRASNLAFFIGSGCSTPSVPMMGTTMKEILSKPENTDIKLKVYDFVRNGLIDEFSDIEGLLNWIQSGISFERNEVKRSELKSIFEKIKKEFIRTIPKFGDDQYAKSQTIDTYTKFYRSIFNSRRIESTKLSVFTTNYDLFNEIAMEHNNFSYTTGFSSDLSQSFDINQFKYRLVDDTERYKDKWQPVKKEANLYKIHGSINWYQDSNGRLRQGNGKEENIVIYPTVLKHRETAQSPYSELFREFSTTLQKPNTTLIVMGYGFPDEHINNIISQNLQNQDFNLIIFGDKDEEKMKEFYRSFEKKRNVHLIGGLFEDGTKGHYFNLITDKYLLRETAEKTGEKDA